MVLILAYHASYTWRTCYSGPLGVRDFQLAMRPCVSLCREDVAELMKDDLYVVRYNPIKDLLSDDWVELV